MCDSSSSSRSLRNRMRNLKTKLTNCPSIRLKRKTPMNLAYLWLRSFFIRLVLLQLRIVSSIEFVIFIVFLLLLLLERVPIIVDGICVQIIPFVDGNNNKIPITFAGNVNRNERVAELIIEIVHWCDLRMTWRGVLRCSVVWIENVDAVVARSRWRWKIVSASKFVNSSSNAIVMKVLRVRPRICNVIRLIFPDRCGLTVGQMGWRHCCRCCGDNRQTSRSKVDLY